MKKLILILIIVLVGIFTYSQISSVGNMKIEQGKYVIQKGDTVGLLPKRFGLNVNSVFYKLWLRMYAPDVKLQAGTYSVSSEITLNEVFINTLKKPDFLDQEITILPGWNIFDIDDYLANKGIIKNGELIYISDNISADLKQKFSFLDSSKSLEGFLYPDTYRLPFDIKIEDLASVLLREFNDKIYSKYGEKLGNKFYDKLILASIVEKEERNSTNKPIVVGILAKRLKDGIAIGADATVCYEYKKTSKECTPSFIGEKIYINSKYNTRNKIGLPPTPISNLTDDTFEAVFNPEGSEYYYYLHDMDGNIHYGKTLQEHINNKNLYLK